MSMILIPIKIKLKSQDLQTDKKKEEKKKQQ